MSAIAIIQARMSSTRLPGKVLLPLAGKPMIWHIVERARACKLVDVVIVATSVEASDDPLASFCADSDIPCFRGSLDNVLSRFVEILKTHPADFFVRITGDCPLIDPIFIDRQLDALAQFEGDCIWCQPQSSVLEGQGVLSFRALTHIARNSSHPHDLEHVGSRYLAENPEEFRIVGLRLDPAIAESEYRFTVDEISDYKMLRLIYDDLWKSQPIELKDVISWIKDRPWVGDLNRQVSHSAINTELMIKRQVVENFVSVWAL